ncbi:MAG: hypothetical protein KAS32_15495 [Candidatus Peribacteraceae bacterium]|nr:hypothetical protein [Candidatus Peribacteraceae bacterium]
MGDVTNLVCDQLLIELERQVQSIEASARVFNNAVEAVEDTWNSIVDVGMSPVNEIKSATGSIKANLQDALPDLTSTDAFAELEAIIAACTTLDDPLSTLRGLQASMDSAWADYLGEISDAVNEILAMIDMQRLKLDLTSFKISDQFTIADKIINCLATFCAADALGNPIQEVIDIIDSSMARLETAQDQMRLDDAFELDDTKVLENGGVAETHITSLLGMSDAVSTSRQAFDETYDDSIDAAKGNTVSQEKDLSTYLNFPVFDSTSSELYSELDPAFENQDLWLEVWNDWSMLTEQVFGTENLDVTFRVLTCILEEKPDPDITCYSEYTMEMEVQIGTVSYSDTKNYIYGTPICDACGNYPAGGLPECDEENIEYARLYTGRASSLAIKEILDMFTLEEIKSQL